MNQIYDLGEFSLSPGGHCARLNQAGWWYRGHRGCFQAHPTGVFQTRSAEQNRANQSTTVQPEPMMRGRNTNLGPFIYWFNWRGSDLYPKTMFLMTRPSRN